MAKRSGGNWGGVIGAVVLACGAALFATPYFAAASALDALQRADEAKIEAAVDFDALKLDLSREVEAQLDAHFKSKGVGAAEKMMADMIVRPFLEQAVQQVATPQALAGMIKASRKEGDPPETYQNLVGFTLAKGGFQSFDLFAVTLEDASKPDQPAAKLQFGRRNLVSWKLVGVDLPPGALSP
jgi:Protein of unknown function (DUF2939)